MANRKITRGDQVMVVTGDEKGKQGKVLRMAPGDRLVVEGVNYIWKHLRKTQKTPQGGRLQKEAPLHISNVMLVNPKSGKPERVGVRREEGKAVRYFKRSDNPVGKVSD